MRRHSTSSSGFRLAGGRPALRRDSTLRSRLIDGGKLWIAWLRAPRHVGALLPSGMRLSSAMARSVPGGRGLVVELGGGTGSITAGLLCAGIQPAELVVVERDPLLAACLRRRFPDCRVLCGDACRLPQLLEGHGIRSPVKAVVSSLPLLTMPAARRARLMRGVARVLPRDGVMVQYTYGMGCPVPARALLRGNVRAERIGRIWQNVPPASVWRFEPAAVGRASGPRKEVASEP